MNAYALTPIILASLFAVSCVAAIILCVYAGYLKPDLDEANGEEIES